MPDDIVDLVEVDETGTRIQNIGRRDNGSKYVSVGTLGTLELPDGKKNNLFKLFFG